MTITHEMLYLTSRLKFIKQIIYDDSIRGRELSEPWIKKLDDIRRAGEAVTDEELSAARESVQPGDTLRLFSTSVSLAIISSASVLPSKNLNFSQKSY